METSSFISSTITGECLIFSTHEQDMQQASISFKMIMDVACEPSTDRGFHEILIIIYGVLRFMILFVFNHNPS
jgi:hypothetical protein